MSCGRELSQVATLGRCRLPGAWGSSPASGCHELFESTTERVYDRSAEDEWFAVARTSSKERPEALSGFHGAPGSLLFILEEASGVLEATFETAEGALSSPGARVIMVGNPTRNIGDLRGVAQAAPLGIHQPALPQPGFPLVDPEYRPRLVRKFGRRHQRRPGPGRWRIPQAR